MRRAARSVAERARGLARDLGRRRRGPALATASKVGAGPACARGRQVARAGRQRAAARLQEALHDPVLEAVEGDDGEAAAGRKHLLGGREPALELGELLVHVDADRLEGPGRRILLHAGMVAERLADDLGELAGPLDRPRRDDRPRDPARLRLLAIMDR